MQKFGRGCWLPEICQREGRLDSGPESVIGAHSLGALRVWVASLCEELESSARVRDLTLPPRLFPGTQSSMSKPFCRLLTTSIGIWLAKWVESTWGIICLKEGPLDRSGPCNMGEWG
jgi:hypothetical protein